MRNVELRGIKKGDHFVYFLLLDKVLLLMKNIYKRAISCQVGFILCCPGQSIHFKSLIYCEFYGTYLKNFFNLHVLFGYFT